MRKLLLVVTLLLVIALLAIPSQTSDNTANALLNAIAPTGNSAGACVFGFCDDCEAEANDVYFSWVEATGSGCTALQKSAQYCYQNCPTCKFCSIRIRTFNTTCP